MFTKGRLLSFLFLYQSITTTPCRNIIIARFSSFIFFLTFFIDTVNDSYIKKADSDVDLLQSRIGRYSDESDNLN